MLDMMHMHGSEFLGEVPKHINVNLNGYLGGEAFGSSYQERHKMKGIDKRIDADIASILYGKHAVLSDVSDEYYNIHHVEAYDFTNRSRRFINMGTVNGLVKMDQRKPFIDNATTELIFSLPDEYRVDNRLYSAMLQKFFPRFFLDIPWQKTGKPAGVARQASIPARAARKGVRILKQLVKIHSTKGFADYPAWIRDKEVADKLQTLFIRGDARYRMLTEDDLAKRWLEPHLKSKAVNYSDQILRVATIEIYLRKVFGETV